MNTCINCGSESTGNFCSNCGQKLQLQKITLNYLLSEFKDHWLGLDTKFARTVKDLTHKPKEVISTFLDRNSVKYIGPFGYYIIVTALLLIVFDLIGMEVKDFLRLTNENFGLQQDITSTDAMEMQQRLSNLMARHFRFVPGFLIPFLALSSFIFYRKTGYNYLEHIVITTYLQSHTMWLLIIGLLIYITTGFWMGIFTTLASLLYYIWALSRFMPAGNRIKGVIKTFFTWLFGYLIFLIAGIIMLTVYIFLTVAG